MGMYTTLDVDIRLKSDTDEKVKWLIWALVGEGDSDDIPKDALPSHPFWHDSRFGSLGCGLYDGATIVSPSLEGNLLKIRCEVKNYDRVLQKFLDWITPYVESVENGYIQLEEWESRKVHFDGRFKLEIPSPPDYWAFDRIQCDDHEEPPARFEYIPTFS